MGLKISNLYRSARIAGTGLRANRNWMNIISNNIANANSLDTGMKDKAGNFVPYARQVPVFSKVLSEKFRSNKINEDVLNGVAVKEVAELKGSVKKIYNPTHPAARKPGTKDAGYVYYPKVNTTQEMADMRMASASYEANLSVMSTSNRMIEQALRIGRRS